jgi:hypothetical protein
VFADVTPSVFGKASANIGMLLVMWWLQTYLRDESLSGDSYTTGVRLSVAGTGLFLASLNMNSTLRTVQGSDIAK